MNMCTLSWILFLLQICIPFNNSTQWFHSFSKPAQNMFWFMTLFCCCMISIALFLCWAVHTLMAFCAEWCIHLDLFLPWTNVYILWHYSYLFSQVFYDDVETYILNFHEGFWRTYTIFHEHSCTVNEMKWNEWCFRPIFCTCKAILCWEQPRLMGWILLWIMPLVQDQSVELYVDSVNAPCSVNEAEI